MKRFDVTWLRSPRFTILLVLMIYGCLLLVFYRRSKSSSNELFTQGGREMEQLLEEMSDNKLPDEEVINKFEEVEKDEVAAAIDAAADSFGVQSVQVIAGGGKDDSRNLLEAVFRDADIDDDDLLDIRELAKWIHSKIIEHIDRAMKDNVGLFTAIDNNPRDGEISWAEYHAHFLRTHGMSDNYVASHDKHHSALTKIQKEAIMRDRARWAEAARNDPDKLTLDEFLAFTHPESSHRVLLHMVDDLFEKFDRDGDEQLTEDEFSDLPSEGVNVDQSVSMPVSQERREEFRHLIDKDKNGKADRAELLAYIDPRNPRHAIQEARHLIELSDVDHDGKLKLPELLSKTDLFLGSKMIDTEGSFHDEFR